MTSLEQDLDITNGRIIEIEKDLKEETLNEVLSRMERIRAKVRFARTSAKRERSAKLALKRHSTTTTITWFPIHINCLSPTIKMNRKTNKMNRKTMKMKRKTIKMYRNTIEINRTKIPMNINTINKQLK
jgi:hypothetical protein